MSYKLMSLFILSYLAYRSNAEISCYTCTAVQNQYYLHNESSRACAHFEETEEFETWCQYSTFCVKKTSEYKLLDGEVVRIEERGCADQKYERQQLNSIGTAWEPVKGIEETIYKDGCFPESNAGIKAAKTKYCYCSSNYCNTSKRTSDTSFFHYTDTMSVIFIFNVVKLMRSIR